ncbi:ATP-binding protein [Novosphingobium sp. 9U]|uniref:ATP-binding protein n=1 Tax=Novosphingobium sp. 9U TaxID=2653158 RepID=UPI0012EFAC35|nr:ATP-binding protein [Novosphingobium sp. 9U]VWX48808.1 Sensor histidine kinase PrrB (RegB) [Novosphingobium sp. 9U]
MDKPLLPFTTRVPAGPSPETAAVENMRQLIQLRWIAVAGQTLTILLTHYVLQVPLALAPMLGLSAFLAVANLLATMALARQRVFNTEVMLALLIDMAALTLQLYFSGGASNPFVSLFLLQVVLGAILLPPLAAGLLAAAAALSYGLLSLRYIPLALPDSALDLLAVGRWTAFLMVAGLLVFFIARISRNLRARDGYLADLRQHAAEEEGIVRMGLFASGAAHELGTPLGTLAVILADWRRIPAIARDAELLADVEAMQSEIQRCKGIVTDILHSAGQPRGEPMESAAADAFLTATLDAWRPTHPDVPLEYRPHGIAGALTAVNPELRQAIWSVLDNAAEVSPAAVRLQASVQDGMLAIVVHDEGPGFPAQVLAQLGRPYQSSKGAGHGLGLFLAANVVRRLGGKLEAANRPEGGAEVTLTLPLAGVAGADRHG